MMLEEGESSIQIGASERTPSALPILQSHRCRLLGEAAGAHRTGQRLASEQIHAITSCSLTFSSEMTPTALCF